MTTLLIKLLDLVSNFLIIVGEIRMNFHIRRHIRLILLAFSVFRQVSDSLPKFVEFSDLGLKRFRVLFLHFGVKSGL